MIHIYKIHWGFYFATTSVWCFISLYNYHYEQSAEYCWGGNLSLVQVLAQSIRCNICKNFQHVSLSVPTVQRLMKHLMGGVDFLGGSWWWCIWLTANKTRLPNTMNWYKTPWSKWKKIVYASNRFMIKKGNIKIHLNWLKLNLSEKKYWFMYFTSSVWSCSYFHWKDFDLEKKWAIFHGNKT